MAGQRTVAVLGTGTIGASWTALFLAHGLQVRAWDPAPDAADRLRDFVERAWPALEQLGSARLAHRHIKADEMLHDRPSLACAADPGWAVTTLSLDAAAAGITLRPEARIPHLDPLARSLKQ